MKRAAPQHESLKPGEHCRISEGEWFAVLESAETLHQWGSALLVEEGVAMATDDAAETLVRAYWRDDSEAHRHTAWRFDTSTSQHVRTTVAAIEEAAASVADLLAQAEARGASTLDQMRTQDEASEAYVQLAEDFYRELLRLGPGTT